MNNLQRSNRLMARILAFNNSAAIGDLLGLRIKINRTRMEQQKVYRSLSTFSGNGKIPVTKRNAWKSQAHQLVEWEDSYLSKLQELDPADRRLYLNTDWEAILR